MVISARKPSPRGSNNVLFNGDARTQKEFHCAYEAMPAGYRAELIGGIVFEPSPLGFEHGEVDARLACLLGQYAAKTLGINCALNATVILSDEDEVQPDVLIRIEPRLGGQSGDQKGKTKNTYYVKGAPELVAEVAHSSYAIDLHLKKVRYILAGVGEYLVVCLEPAQIHWFDCNGKGMKPDKNGIYKSKILPGLWIDGQALLDLNYEASMATLNAGMQTREYAKFVSHLSEKAGS